MSPKSCDISRIIFFIKLQVKLYRLPDYLVEFKDEIDEKKHLIFGMSCTIIVIVMIMIGVLWG